MHTNTGKCDQNSHSESTNVPLPFMCMTNKNANHTSTKKAHIHGYSNKTHFLGPPNRGDLRVKRVAKHTGQV